MREQDASSIALWASLCLLRCKGQVNQRWFSWESRSMSVYRWYWREPQTPRSQNLLFLQSIPPAARGWARPFPRLKPPLTARCDHEHRPQQEQIWEAVINGSFLLYFFLFSFQWDLIFNIFYLLMQELTGNQKNIAGFDFAAKGHLVRYLNCGRINGD